MHIDHVHFYVENARESKDWFVETLGFQWLATGMSNHTQTEVVRSGEIYLLLSSPCDRRSSVADYLAHHPPGVADLAFQVDSLDAFLDAAAQGNVQILSPGVQSYRGDRWAVMAGWSDLRHTLIQRHATVKQFPGLELLPSRESTPPFQLLGFDHVVLNVVQGDLWKAIAWYEQVLGLQRQQAFSIQTNHSGLCSQVLTHPRGTLQLPINEPASPNSQIQEFLDLNRGAGIQHIALTTADAIGTIADLRQRGLLFLSVPQDYYEQVKHRPQFPLRESEWRAIAQQQILVDWHLATPQAPLLQAFTQPIFQQPTFFFEIIERRTYCTQQATGFGEGNFQALFEAIEREQMRRGSLLNAINP